MGDRETARMRKYGESETTPIMMATVPHVTSGLGLTKFQADGFLLTQVYQVVNPGRSKRFFSFKVQTSYGAHVVSYSLGSQVISQGSSSWGMKLITHRCPMLMFRIYVDMPSWNGQRLHLLFYLHYFFYSG